MKINARYATLESHRLLNNATREYSPIEERFADLRANDEWSRPVFVEVSYDPESQEEDC